jgi:hypothetical protein
MDPEVRKALYNLKRRQAKIDKEYGKTEDDGPLFGRRFERKNRREEEAMEELFDSEYEE